MAVILIYFLVINILGFTIIFYDKKRAATNKFRIPEKNLLVIVFFGGLIGSGLAMVIFRHKTSKKSYLSKFFGIIFIQILVLFLSYKI